MSRPLPFLRLTFASIALAAMGITPAIAAPKADPKPLDQRQPAADIRGFAQAYERANEPEMIVVCGIVTGGPQAGERAIANFDPAADSDALRRRIEELLLEARVELIEQSSLDAAKQREHRRPQPPGLELFRSTVVHRRHWNVGHLRRKRLQDLLNDWHERTRVTHGPDQQRPRPPESGVGV